MPRIPTPVSDPKLPQQIFTAEGQGATAARAQQDLAQSVVGLGAALQQRQTQREVSRLNAEFAKAQAELTVDWQETLRTADPNDLETAERFRNEKVKTRLDQIGELAETREGKDYFSRLSAGLGANFLVTTESGMAGLAEVAAVQSFETVKNQMADAAGADPLSFDTNVASTKMMINGFVSAHNLSREAALKLESEAISEVAFAAGMGRITANIAEGRAFVEAGGYSEFLDTSKKAQLISYANSLEASQRAAAERAKQELADATSVSFVRRAINPDGSINTEAIPALQAELFRNANISGDRETAMTTSRFLDGLLSGGATQKLNSPAVQADLLRRASLPPGDPNRLTANEALGFAGRGVDFTFINNQLIPTIQRAASPDGQNDNERVKAHLSLVRGQLGLGEGIFSSVTNNPRAQQAFDEYQTWFYTELARRQDTGETLTTILNPASPAFIGQGVEQFIPPPQEGDLTAPEVPSFSITLDPRFRRVTFDGAPGKIRSPEELDKLLQEGE